MRHLLAALLLAFHATPTLADLPVQGLDHVPVVVRDLERAKADFEALGFVLKPGRFHANGLRNEHAKFADGTEIELIMPTRAADALSSRYLDWLRQGDGPVSLGLYRLGAPAELSAGIFFDRRQKSPTDRPEHFAHPNSAVTLSGAWLAGDPAERQLLGLPGGRLLDGAFCAPFGSSSKALRFEEGKVILFPESAQVVRGRPILAITVTVGNLDAARHLLLRNRVVPRQVAGCARKSVWVEINGLWLEFVER